MIEPIWAGHSPEELNREFDPTAATIRHWLKQANLDERRWHDGTTTAERQEITRLRREIKQLRLGHEIPAKAAAWFPRETGSIPPESSSS